MAEEKLVVRIAAKSDAFQKEIDKVADRTKNLEEQLQKVAEVSAIAFAGFATAAGASLKAFADFEDGLIGVGKTTGIAGEELDKMGEKIAQLSTEIPVATSELLAIGQSAGQLGVTGSDNIIKFSETIAKLGRASNLSGDQAATQLTRILTVTGDGVETIDRFASVVVRLGNNFAASESEIANVATRVAQTTSVFDLGATNVAGMATALRSLGIQSEVAGSVIGRSFQAIDKSLREGGKSLQRLQDLTGMTRDQLQETFEEDATEVFRQMVKGLGEVEEAGGSSAAAMEDLGLKGVRVNQVMGALASGADTLDEALATARDEAEKNTALNKEFAVATESLSSQFQLLVNDIIELGRKIGTVLAPVAESAIKAFRGLFDVLNNDIVSFLSSQVVLFGTALTGMVATVSGGALAFVKLKKAITIANVALQAANISVKTLVGSTGIGLLVILAAEVIANWESVKAFFVEDLVPAVTGFFENLSMGFMQTSAQSNAAVAAMTGNLDKFKEKTKEFREETKRDPAEADAEEKKNRDALVGDDQKTKSQAERQKEIQNQFIQSALERNTAFQELSKEQQEAFRTKNLEKLRSQVKTEQQIKNEAIKKELEAEAKKRNELLAEQQKHGMAMAKIRQVTGSKEVSAAGKISDQLVALQQSESEVLQTIGKAAALTKIGIKTAEGAMAAYSAAQIFPPPLGQILGAAAAAAVVAFGAEQAASVISANQGGVVPGNASGANVDSQLGTLTPGELVTPRKNFDEVVNAVAKSRNERAGVADRGTQAAAGGRRDRVEISFVGDAAEMLEGKILTRQRQGTSLIQRDLSTEDT